MLTNEMIQALNRAILKIAERRDIDETLQEIVDSARDLLQAQYAALGVPNANGRLEAFIHSGMPSRQAAMIPHLPQGHGLLGAIVSERKTIRLPKLSADVRSSGFPEGHPPMDSFLGVPVIAGGEVLGNLYFTNKLGADEFSEQDVEVTEMFAAHAAVAIRNARLDEDVQRLTVLEERNRIGMDLHDGVIQSIYAVGLTLESARLSLNQEDEESMMLLSRSIVGLNDTIRDIRNFILDLRPHRYNGDLKHGVERLVREFRANTMIEVDTVFTDHSLDHLSPAIGRAVFLSAQNALANIARHANASFVQLSINYEEDYLRLIVQDNGCGFDMHKGGLISVGHGLHNMQTRAERLGGQFHLESAVGEGTLLSVSIPLH